MRLTEGRSKLSLLRTDTSTTKDASGAFPSYIHMHQFFKSQFQISHSCTCRNHNLSTERFKTHDHFYSKVQFGSRTGWYCPSTTHSSGIKKIYVSFETNGSLQMMWSGEGSMTLVCSLTCHPVIMSHTDSTLWACKRLVGNYIQTYIPTRWLQT